MLEKSGMYAACKAKVQAIEAAYDALVAATEAYQEFLTMQIAQANPADDSENHFLVVANLQRNTATGIINTLDTDAHDDLIRLSDRVIRFKHWEEGVFV